MDITEISIMHHAGIVLFGLWLLSFFNRCHPVAYFVSLIYIYLVHERYVMRLRRRLQFEEKKQAYQKRILTDSETVRWLNHAVEKMWPICLEQIASQKILFPIIPWFLEKYKPWTAKKAVVQHLYLGRNPPLFTEMRVLGQCSGDDHLVLELGMNFLSADDMSAILAVKLRKRLGFGMWAKLHLTGMHVEGKVLVGVKFLRQWPFLGRLRICFAEPPYFQMTVKPIFTHGLDVAVLPGIAGWLEKLLSLAFEQTLVQPNMLVVDMEKFASTQSENWFSVDERKPVAYAQVEVVEASDIKPSDLNGLADPYVKGQLGPYRFRTKIQRKTLLPKWHEEFKIPICAWESLNVLEIEVRDKDRFVDDTLGCCSININDLRDGERHVMWLPLKNIKMGRLNLAITVLEENAEGAENQLNKEEIRDNFGSETASGASFSSLPRQKSQKVADNFEPINIEGQEETGVWVHQPGSEVLETWESRKGKSRQLDAEIRGVPNDSFGSSRSRASGSLNNESSASDEHSGEKNPMNKVRRGLHKMTAVFHRNPKNEDDSGSSGEIILSPYENIRSVKQKEIGVKFVVDDNLPAATPVKDLKVVCVSPEGSSPESPGKGKVKDMAKSLLKHAEKSARNLKQALSRKGSRKSRVDSSLVTEREIYPDTESSDDESLSSLHVLTVPDTSNPMSCGWGSVDSNETKESVIVQAGSSVPATKNEDQVGRVPTEGQERAEDEEVSSSNLHGNGLEDSSGTQPGEQNLDLEKSSDIRLEERIEVKEGNPIQMVHTPSDFNSFQEN